MNPEAPGVRSLRSAVLRHNNDYGGDPCRRRNPTALSVACVVPYHETGELGQAAVRSVAASLDRYRRLAPHGVNTRLTVVDDGSLDSPFIEPVEFPHEVVVHKLPANVGRAAARNAGLRQNSAFDVVLFIDSDVVVQPMLVADTVAAWSVHDGQIPQPAIVPSFFMTVRGGDLADLHDQLPRASFRHDWRAGCRYEPSWIGCPADYAYVGRQFRLLEDTHFFLTWRGAVGPFILPNMVLGGCFAVPGGPALHVGGFDDSFDTYGFTETTLVARLVANGFPVVPQVCSSALHVEWNPSHQAQAERNIRFREAHQRFFHSFMARPLREEAPNREAEEESSWPN